jgi:hypothetical protein
VAIELAIGGWLLRQAYKAILVPVGDDLRQRLNQRLADAISKHVDASVLGRLFPALSSSASKSVEAAEAAVPDAADADFVSTLETNPAAADAMRGGLEDILGVPLGSSAHRRGTDGWYLSSYESVLWRIGLMATWEGRPIALSGALQGADWLTVCVPHVATVPVPVDMWRRPDERTSLRLLQNPPVDFFVRQITDDGRRTSELDEISEELMLMPERGFDPPPGPPDETAWHRVDGLHRGWVILHPDPAAHEEILAAKQPSAAARNLFATDLRLHPPSFDQYPRTWRGLLRIPNEAGAIAALNAGADAFATASEASTAAVEALISANDEP